MSLVTEALRPARLLRFLHGGAVPMLSLVLVALLGVFWLLLGDRIVGIGALQSMAFQLPELGILSLAMMVALLLATNGNLPILTFRPCARACASVMPTLPMPGSV